MPIISGVMCLMFPIGVGIYWIAGNVFRIFQSLFINLHFSKMDMDEMIQANVEKAKKKYEKMGMDSSVLEKAAKTRTSNINTTQTKSENVASQTKSVSDTAKKTSNKQVKKKNNTKYKDGSIAAYANMLNRDDNK
jgi:YidC/Oxa1 family membrane protein insertase